MAKLTPQQWELARADYEVKGLSIREIAKHYDVNASTVSRQAKKDDWKQSKTQHLVDKKVNAIMQLHQTQQQMQQLNAIEQQAIDNEVALRLARENLFVDSALRNQKRANELLEMADDLAQLNQHSQITARNKETVLGKNPETAIQINNQNSTPPIFQLNPVKAK